MAANQVRQRLAGILSPISKSVCIMKYFYSLLMATKRNVTITCWRLSYSIILSVRLLSSSPGRPTNHSMPPLEYAAFGI